MTTTSATSSTAATSATSLTANNPYASLGAGDYMKLLTTEMQNQDPTQPVDETQMIGQMAQFSELEGVDSMGTTLTTMSGTLNSILAAQQAATSAAATGTGSATDTSGSTTATTTA